MSHIASSSSLSLSLSLSLCSVVIWDSDAPCGPDKAYIHYAGVAMMTSGAGATTHTYRAGSFDTLPVPSGTTGCHDFTLTAMPSCGKEWQVAVWKQC
jgi:hypothetical protein